MQGSSNNISLQNNNVVRLKSIREIHHNIARMVFSGMKDKEIAKALDVSPQMVSYTRKQPLIQEKLEHMRAFADMDAVEVQKEIQALAPYALNVMEELMLDRTTKQEVRAKLAGSILDRAGHGAIRKHQVLTGHLTKEDMDEIKKEAAQYAPIRRNGSAEVEDAEVIEIGTTPKEVEKNGQ